MIPRQWKVIQTVREKFRRSWCGLCCLWPALRMLDANAETGPARR